MNRIINFIKYHNAFAIGVSLVLVLTFSAMASEDVRNTVIGEEIKTEQGTDNSQILAADLDNFDMALQIQNVTEDAEKYYIDYIYKTIAIVDNSWQEVWKEKRLAVSKKNLGDGDLALYVTEELSQVVDSELAYLKEVQEIEREGGLQKIVASVGYTGLLGLLSDLKAMVSPELACQPRDEVCDAVDNDCDGLIDEDLGQTTCGVGACQVTVDNCLNEALVACVPGTPSEEICGDGIDNNCDGIVDNPKICRSPTPPVEGGSICQPTTEVCDGIDNNCDGEIDEGGVCGTAVPLVEDVCDATHLNLCTTQAECETVAGFWYNEACNAEPEVPAEPEELVCDNEHLDLCTTQELCEGASLYWYNETCDLEPETPVCQPTEEVCDGLDNDCDGEVDEGVNCGVTVCDTSLNLTGECQNACLEGICQTCVPTCACAEGFSDCDNDMSNGCETAGNCLPAEPPTDNE